MKKKLKLYVWDGDDILRDYTPGMICILAHSIHEARKILFKKYDFQYYVDETRKPYKIITKPEAFAVSGGG